MKISVITVTYNSEATITDTVESVLSQTYPEVEYLIIDGGSSDATLAKLKPYREQIDVLVSEPDRGMYDAMNKGIARASGDVVAILNSDDVYIDNEVLARVASAFAQDLGLHQITPAQDGVTAAPFGLGPSEGDRSSLHDATRLSSSKSGTGGDGGRTFLSASGNENQPEVVYGDLHYVSEDLRQVVRDWQSGRYQAGQFRRGWHPPHPSFFVKRSVYEALGAFNLDLRIAADYEFMLRVLEKHRKSVAYLPEVLVKMRTGGASNRSVGNILKANRECYQAWRMNGYSAWTAACAILRKPFSKLKQLRRKVPT